MNSNTKTAIHGIVTGLVTLITGIGGIVLSHTDEVAPLLVAAGVPPETVPVIMLTATTVIAKLMQSPIKKPCDPETIPNERS